jgi:hypothetical protein
MHVSEDMQAVCKLGTASSTVGREDPKGLPCIITKYSIEQEYNE